MSFKRVFVTVCLTAALLVPGLATGSMALADPVPITGTGTVRLSGADRYATAVAISQRAFTSPQDLVFIVSGENFPDALAAGPAAGQMGAPILLVRRSAVPGVVLRELKRLAPQRVLVIGGTGVIDESAVAAIRTAVSGASIERIGGRDRSETAVAIARLIGTDRFVLVSGEDFADGLSGGALAAAMGGALILQGGRATENLFAFQDPASARLVIVGGYGVISLEQEQWFTEDLFWRNVARVDGKDRYETSANVAALFDDHPPQSVFLASGVSFPDAVAGTPAAAIAPRGPVMGSPVVLTKATCHPAPTWNLLQKHSYPLKVVLGGTSVAYGGARRC